jgi:hypothetical protein
VSDRGRAAKRGVGLLALTVLAIGACGKEESGDREQLEVAVNAGSLADSAVHAAEALLQNACKGMPICSYEGHCSLVDGECRAAEDAGCKASLACVDWGTCAAEEGRCVAASSEDCAKAWTCINKGRCSAHNGSCVVDDDADCGRSKLCKHERKCRARNGRCVKES